VSRRRLWLAVALGGAVGIGSGFWSKKTSRTSRSSDYDRDLAALVLDDAAGAGRALEPAAQVRRAGWLQRRGSLTGNPEDLVEALRLIEAATAVGDASDPVALMAAMLALDLHRVGDARRWLAGVSDRDLWLVAATEGDLAVQDGRLDEAAARYAKARAAHPGWEVLARLANLGTLRGDRDGADRLYAEAEADVDAKSMRTFAWLEVQRGRAAFARGRFDEARLRYDRAARAYSGDWQVEARRAELAAARGEGALALAAYTRVAEQSGSPEIAQATGELHAYLGRPAEAALWYQRALVGYTRSVERGEVHYLHALAGFHADVSGDAAAALRWAEKDHALRPGVAAVRDQLAWALFRAGRLDDARRESASALAMGAPDTHALYHAAMLALAAGRSDEGAALLQRVASLNPVYMTTFHAHH
jgi:predicted negative regulator of RcsB-dependent stress response